MESARVDESFDINFSTSAQYPRSFRAWNPRSSRNPIPGSNRSPKTQEILDDDHGPEYEEVKEFINEPPGKSYHELLDKMRFQAISKLQGEVKTPKLDPIP